MTDETGDIVSLDHFNRARLQDARKKVLAELTDLGAYLYYSAATGSQYIKFGDPRLGSLRIADHSGIQRYRYKWNLLLGGSRKTEYDGKVRREFYPLNDLRYMAEHMRIAQQDILEKYGNYDPSTDPNARTRSRSLKKRKKPKRKKR